MGGILRFFESVIYGIKRISNRFNSDNLTAYAAQAAFFTFISIFPFLMLLLSLLKYIPIQQHKYRRLGFGFSNSSNK